jgi:WD40 repeat protein
VSGFSLSPDGRTLATSTDYDGSSNRGKDKPARDEIRVWDIVTGKSLGTIEVGEPHVPAIAFSPDGGTLAAIVLDENAMTRGKTARISLFDLKTRKPVGTLDKGREVISTLFGRPSLAYSPDGDTLAAGAGREVSLWNVRERNLKRRIPISGSFAETSSVRFLRDGRTLAILVSSPGRAGSYGGGIELRDAATGALTGRIREVGGALVSTPDGKSLLSMAGSRGLAFCDPASAQVRTTFPLQAQTVAISSDGRIVATALNSGAAISNMPKEGTLEIKFWDVGPPQTVAMFPQEGGGLMPDGKTLALWSGSEEPIELWDLHPLRRRAVIETLTVDSFCRAVRPDGKVLALGGSSGSERDRMMARFGGGKLPGQVSLWDTGTGKNLKTFEVGRGLVLSITYSPDGRQLAVVNSIRSGQERNLTITIWNPDAGRASVAFPLPKTSGRLCTFSPDGNVLAFNAEDGRVILIDLTKRTFLPALKVKGRSNLLDRLKFTKDGRRLIVHRGGGPGVTTIWDWHAGTEVREPIPAEFRNPAISRDGRYQLERTSAGLRLIDRSWKARQSRGVRNPRWKG